MLHLNVIALCQLHVCYCNYHRINVFWFLISFWFLLRWSYIRGLTGSFIIPANEFRRGHRIDEHALVSSCVHPWFLTLRQLSGKLIPFTPNFKLLCMYLFSMFSECSEWTCFWSASAQFWPSDCQIIKMVEIGYTRMALNTEIPSAA